MKNPHLSGFVSVRGRVFGGGGGNRTRVRKPSAIGPTCLARFIVFSLPPPKGQGDQSAIPLGFSGSGPDARHRDPMCFYPRNPPSIGRQRSEARWD